MRLLIIFAIITFGLFTACNKDSSEKSLPTNFLNLNDSVKYVGKETCKTCHQSIYDSFIQTGMGQSFDTASRQKSKADFTQAIIFDNFKNFYYQAFWDNNNFFIKEYRLFNGDTVHKNIQKVGYIIGSGQHTNSHIINKNGYLYQAPMTFYTQKRIWDLPPGFEKGHNKRFDRKINLECLSCHNAYPQFVKGSDNKYTNIPNGIDCERCHGPGQIHVERMLKGQNVDTAKSIDYSIVNPAKLPIYLQFDVCQRCHLQGNAVLKPNKTFFDFKPGMKLSDIMTVFLPQYTNAVEDFIMASHPDRLAMSRCFIESSKKTNSNALKPYKNALTCVSCHNPHVSVKKAEANHFNKKCQNCHEKAKNNSCSEAPNVLEAQNLNCVKCHMPKSSSIDIPHVSITDHYIRKPIATKNKNAIKTFIGLKAINEKLPDSLTIAKAYINQYEQFTANKAFLDSAQNYLPKPHLENLKKYFVTYVHLSYLQENYQQIIDFVKAVLGNKTITNSKILFPQDYNNTYAWTLYRIAKAHQYTGQTDNAIYLLEKTVLLAPYSIDFRKELAMLYLENAAYDKAKAQFEYIAKEQQDIAPVYSNLGYFYMLEGMSQKAKQSYEKAIQTDPDYEKAFVNLAGWYAYNADYKKAKQILEDFIRQHPKTSKTSQETLKKIKNF